MGKIFFSYRPVDSKHTAERIYERLQYNYGRDDVHLDLKMAPTGEDLQTYLQDFLTSYSVFLTVIGPGWAESHTRAGARRLDDPHDLVRAELDAAFAIGMPVLPILVRGARLPASETLPDGLKPLAELTSFAFGGDDAFRGDMLRLHHQLARLIVTRDAHQMAPTPVDTPPSPARKAQLGEVARTHLAAKKPPFQGVRLETLGEVIWVLGAQSGHLGALYGERQFPPDLTGANLTNLNLRGADLPAARLAQANLAQSNLSGANLTDADLSDANLTEAFLDGARLDGAALRAANLQLAHLDSCSLTRADLSEVNHLPTATLAGVDFRGANLSHAHLAGMDLPNALLSGAILTGAKLTDANLPHARLDGAHLEHVALDGANLTGAALANADLSRASLGKTDLSAANLAGATVEAVDNLRSVILDAGTHLDDIRWGGHATTPPWRVQGRDERARAYREAAQINHDLARMLRDNGFVAEASRYHLIEQRMRRGVLVTTGHYGAWLFSSALNAISGYGERIGRTLATYLTVILGFALLYFAGTNFLGLGAHLTLGQALIQSVVSFHGRGFVSSTLQLRDPMAGVTVLESVAGLFIEAIFIATFSRRFLGD